MTLLLLVIPITLSLLCSAEKKDPYPLLTAHLKSVADNLHDAAKSLVSYPTNPDTEEGQYIFDLYVRTKAVADDMALYGPLFDGRMLWRDTAGMLRGMRDVYMRLVDRSVICEEAEASLEKAVASIKAAISFAEQASLTDPRDDEFIR